MQLSRLQLWTWFSSKTRWSRWKLQNTTFIFRIRGLHLRRHNPHMRLAF